MAKAKMKSKTISFFHNCIKLALVVLTSLYFTGLISPEQYAFIVACMVAALFAVNIILLVIVGIAAVMYQDDFIDALENRARH